MSFFFIYSKINARCRNDIIFIISKEYNRRIIIIKMLRVKHFDNVYLFAIWFAIIIIIIFATIFLYVLHFDQFKFFDN